MPESKKPAAKKATAAQVEETTIVTCCDDSPRVKVGGAGGGAVYGLGLIGSAIYYIGQAEGFGEFLVACLKAIVWPAFVVYELLEHMA